MTRSSFSQHEDFNFSFQLIWDTFKNIQLVDAHMIDISQTSSTSYNVMSV